MSKQKHRPRGRVEHLRKIAPPRRLERPSPAEGPRGRHAARPSVQPKESRVSARLATIFRMMDEGFAVLPVVEGAKKPAIKGGHNAASKDKAVVTAWFRARPNMNYGLATGEPSDFFAVDFDGPEGRTSRREFTLKHGLLPGTVIVKTPHGCHAYFRMPKHSIPISAGRIAPGIDIRGDGGYVVGPGSRTPDGTYQFAAGHGPDDVEIAEAPRWLLNLIGRKPAVSNVSASRPKLSADQRVRASQYAEGARQSELDRLRKAPIHQRNNTLNICAYKLGRYVASGLLERATVTQELAQVATAIGLDENEIRATIESGLGAGMKNPARLPFQSAISSNVGMEPPRTSDEQLAKELSRLGENDIANAERFVRRFGDRVLYNDHRGWMVFDGRRYRPNGHLSCVELGKAAVIKIGDELPFLPDGPARSCRARFAEQSKSKGAIDRMLDLAKGRLMVADASLDADPWLLNTETFTIDLRTGYQPHDARDLLTKIAPVEAKSRSACPRFRGFINRITAGDAELAEYIQKAVGLTLTGITSERVLFFVYGKSGSNGKSTLVNLIRDMLGDYGCHTPTETLLTKNYDNAIPADLARLEGARMVTAIESNVNRQLDEAKIKAMTGGEPITARHLYKNFSEFKPQFKLWFVANDRPRVRATDDAIWSRIRVIPLNVKIPSDEVDPDLSRKLKAELPGILSWAIRGCRNWQREGLGEPASVKAATAGWRQDVDHVRRFVMETLVIGCSLDNVVPAGELHGAFMQWCARHGEQPMSTVALKAKLVETFDLTHARTKHGSEWRGVRWKT
jgi:putative DNA primase/helicase